MLKSYYVVIPVITYYRVIVDVETDERDLSEAEVIEKARDMATSHPDHLDEQEDDNGGSRQDMLEPSIMWCEDKDFNIIDGKCGES